MDRLEQKSLVTRRSLKYSYFVSSSGESTAQHPALFFIHGFPDSARLWTDVVAKLGENLPNKIIIPDCLGYAGTDKPKDGQQYAYHLQAQDLVEILAAEKVDRTIIIGHDWGSALTTRVYLHHRQLFSGVVLLNAGYILPSEAPFDLAAVNSLTTKSFGYPQFEYWNFFIAPDAANVIESNLDRMWQALHGDVDDWMKKMFCTEGAMRTFLVDDSSDVPLLPYATESRWKDEFVKQFQSDGFDTALQMYRTTADNIQFTSDSSIPRDKLAIEVPLLFIICTRDSVCVRQIMDPAKAQGLVPDLKEVVVESAHWSPMEKPGEIATHITNFLTERFAKQ